MANDGEGGPPETKRRLPQRPHEHRDDTPDDVYRQSQAAAAAAHEADRLAVWHQQQQHQQQSQEWFHQNGMNGPHHPSYSSRWPSEHAWPNGAPLSAAAPALYY